MPKLLPQQYAKILYKLTHGLSGAELDNAVHAFVLFIKKEQSFKKAPYILKYFKEYADEQNGIAHIEVTTARPLDKNVLSEVIKIFGNSVETETKINPAIIGGMVVRTKNTILDGSIRMQLDRLKQEML